MSERQYFVLCSDNCKFESMTKEQIYDAIAEATGMTPTPVDSAFITMIKEQNANHNMKFWHGTEAQFNALEETDPDTVYVIGTNKVKSVDALEAAVSELQEEVQPVERGGTGATNAEQAMENLGVESYVVEEGDITLSGLPFKYRKWSNGRCECWSEQFGATLNAGVAWCGGYYHEQTGAVDLPTWCSNWVLETATKLDAVLAICTGSAVNNTAHNFKLLWFNGFAGTVGGVTFGKAFVKFVGTYE